MGKALIITEKPSVARDVVAALGGFTPKQGQAYWESATHLVSFVVGHVLELLSPEEIDPAYKSWKLSLLPILPQQFQLKPVQGHEARIRLLTQLIDRADVDHLINACDAAREGELIFRELTDFCRTRKPVQRLWLQSMTPEAIRSGFKTLRSGKEFDGLGAAAECRARSDWLIGMNATRAFSERLRVQGERLPWSVGRVQTPTLALLVEREVQVLEHRPKDFFRVTATFQAPDHPYDGTWFDPQFRKDKNKDKAKDAVGEGTDERDDRIFSPEAAKELQEAVLGRPGVASETREESLRHAPYLFNLTGLQKAMASRYKWTSKRTLEAAQRCYETHKVLTYPRTSSSCLPADYRGEVQRLLQTLSTDATYGAAAQTLLKDGLRNEARTFNDAGVTDHFAIIPTGKLRPLDGDDGKLFDTVVRRFLATFFPPAVYDKVKRLTVVDGKHHFRTGPIETLTTPGWLAVYDKEAAAEVETPARPGHSREKVQLPPLRAGVKNASGVAVQGLKAQLKAEVTRPPPRLSEAMLLGMMENAGRQVEDEELAQALMSAAGLGTAATRADIIQNLKAKGYVDDNLRPLFKGIQLIQTLRRLNVARLTVPELTARLELELSEVERGTRAASRFMSEISQYVTDVVAAARACDWLRLFPDLEPLGRCPVCRSAAALVYERHSFYACKTVSESSDGCGFKLWKDVAGRYLDRPAAIELVNGGQTARLDGFRTKAGRSFQGVLHWGTSGLAFAERSDPGDCDLTPPAPVPRPARQGASAHPDSNRRTLGPCPVHPPGTCQVIESRGAYTCEQRLAAFAAGDTKPYGFWLPKTLCSRPMTEADVKALMQDGVTPELSGFISKTGRAFQAHLRRDTHGNFAFEFGDRPKAPSPSAPPPPPLPRSRPKPAASTSSPPRQAPKTVPTTKPRAPGASAAPPPSFPDDELPPAPTDADFTHDFTEDDTAPSASSADASTHDRQHRFPRRRAGRWPKRTEPQKPND